VSAEKPDLNPVAGEMPWEAAVELILRSKSILLICHVSPDGDAVGSLLGLGLGLRILGKAVTMACENAPPKKYSFLLGFESIVNTMDSFSFDLVIGLDSSDLARLGKVYIHDQLSRIPLINIDHHVTNLFFGNVNLVDTSAASASEIVLRLLDQLDISIEQEDSTDPHSDSLTHPSHIATCLLTGIVTDTLGFRTFNVTPQVMKAAVRLMEAGASLSQVTHCSFNQRPEDELGLLAHGLTRRQVEDGLAWSDITLADRDAGHHPDTGDAGLVGMLVNTREIQMAAVFSEVEKNLVEISFRADPGFDVAQLALSLGGGGHSAASGCTIKGSMEAVKARVLPLMRASFDEQRRSSRDRLLGR
jgi:phosphoesterase RecJ-like protein